MEKELVESLMDIKASVAEMNNILLELSAHLWDLSQMADEIFLQSDGKRQSAVSEFVAKPGREERDTQRIDDMDNEEPADGDAEPEWRPEVPKRNLPHPVTGRSRPRKPEPPSEPPVVAEPPKMPVNRPQTQPTQPKQGIVERLLGKDASDKAAVRAQRMADLEKELAELSKKTR